MRTLFIFGVLFLFSFASFAAPSGKSGRVKIKGFYGLTWVNPADLNKYAKAQTATPKINNITSGTVFGGEFDVRLGSRFEVGVAYEQQAYSNPQNITGPTVSGAGWELTQNQIWALVNFLIVNNGKIYFYTGAGLGYPTESKAKFKYSTTTEYTSDKTLGYRAHGGFGVLFGKHFSLFVEGGYQFITTGNLKNSAGTELSVNGSKVKMDLSGGRAIAGLAFIF